MSVRHKVESFICAKKPVFTIGFLVGRFCRLSLLEYKKVWGSRQRIFDRAATSPPRPPLEVLLARLGRQRPGRPLQQLEVLGVAQVEGVVVRLQCLAERVLRHADGVDALHVYDAHADLRAATAQEHPVQPALHAVPDTVRLEVGLPADGVQDLLVEVAVGEVGQGSGEAAQRAERGDGHVDSSVSATPVSEWYIRLSITYISYNIPCL
jgi:hypothetical protein